MQSITPLPLANQLLDGLPPKIRDRILQECELVNLITGTVLCEPDKTLQYVYFPVTALISLVTHLEGHHPLEIGLIGNEGMLGATLILGVKHAPMRALVQGAGTALRMNVSQFKRELRTSPPLLRRLNAYLYVWMAQLSRTAACAHFHEIEPRLARWLLMTHDRAHADHFRLTQEFLADMLGVHRSGVTIAAGGLQQRKLISYARGEIHILDRNGLEAASCGCYNAITKDYKQFLPRENSEVMPAVHETPAPLTQAAQF